MPSWLTVLGILFVALFVLGAIVDWRDKRRGLLSDSNPNADFYGHGSTVTITNGNQRAAAAAAPLAIRSAAPRPKTAPRKAPRVVPYLTLVVDNGRVPEVRLKRRNSPLRPV